MVIAIHRYIDKDSQLSQCKSVKEQRKIKLTYNAQLLNVLHLLPSPICRGVTLGFITVSPVHVHIGKSSIPLTRFIKWFPSTGLPWNISTPVWRPGIKIASKEWVSIIIDINTWISNFLLELIPFCIKFEFFFLIKKGNISSEKMWNSGIYIYDYAHSFFGADF